MASIFPTALLAQFVVFVVQSEFNYTSCPGPHEIQTADVMNNFDIETWLGIYYENAYHDWTQNPMCPDAQCVASNKSYNASYNLIEDNWSILCTKQEKKYKFRFSLASTGIAGYFNTTVDEGGAVFHEAYYPDTVFAISNTTKPNPINGNKVQYEWALEFQCKMKKELGIEFISFTAVNFYSMYKNPTQQMLNDMINTAYKQGLGVYLERNEGITYLNQTNCTYPWTK